MSYSLSLLIHLIDSLHNSYSSASSHLTKLVSNASKYPDFSTDKSKFNVERIPTTTLSAPLFNASIIAVVVNTETSWALFWASISNSSIFVASKYNWWTGDPVNFSWPGRNYHEQSGPGTFWAKM